MRTKGIGIICIILGMMILMTSVVIIIIIGWNHWQIADVEHDDNSFDIYTNFGDDRKDTAEERIVFLSAFNRGLVTCGMGLMIIGAGFFIAHKARGNWIVLSSGSIAGAVLAVTLLIMTILAGNMLRIEKMENNQLEYNDTFYNTSVEMVTSLGPAMELFAGYEVPDKDNVVGGGYFNFNSLSFVLPILTLLLSIGLALRGRPSDSTVPEAGSKGNRRDPKKDPDSESAVSDDDGFPPPPGIGGKGRSRKRGRTVKHHDEEEAAAEFDDDQEDWD